MPISAADYNFVRDLVRESSAIVLDAGREYLVEARLEPLARERSLGTVGELVHALRREPRGELRQLVVEAMTTNETSFFRDTRYFDALRETIMPELLARGRGNRRLRIWSGAASSGQEAYSIAMLLRELEPGITGWDVQILCTDICESMLQRCREGLFSPLEVGRGLTDTIRERYFAREGAGWRAQPELRSMLRFRRLNLAERSWGDIGGQDIIFLRNVLIYFDQDTKREILTRANRALGKGGYLVLGGAESILNLGLNFDRREVNQAIFYRQTD